jgi:hypothetical protein
MNYVLLIVLAIVIIWLFWWLLSNSSYLSESFMSNPFCNSDVVQVDTSAGDTILGVKESDNVYHLYYHWNGKTWDADWYVCGLPPDTWEYVMFPRRSAALAAFYSKSPEMQKLISVQTRYVRRDSFGHYLYVLQNYMGNTHMRRLNAYQYQLMGRPTALDMYMGMAPAIHPLKPIYEMVQVQNPPNLSPCCTAKKNLT